MFLEVLVDHLMTACSSIFENTGRTDMGLKFEGSVLGPVL